MNRQLSDILDECLKLLAEDGATVEECLALYPQYANDLRPLLEIALKIDRLPRPSPNPAAFAAGKERMLEALAEKKHRQPSPLPHFRAWLAALFGGVRMALTSRRVPTPRLALAGVAVLILLAGGLLVRYWWGMTLTRMATLEATSGTVEVRPGGSDVWLPASPAQRLEPGDRIRTGPHSGAVIAFFDGSRTAMEAETEVTIIEMRSRRDGTAKVILLYQRRGWTYHHVQPLRDSASRFEVETPTAVMAVRGTEFAVAVEADGTTEVKVREGGVRVVARGKAIEVPAGHATSVKPDLPPASPIRAPAPLPPPLLLKIFTLTPLPESAETPTPSATPEPTATPMPPTPTQTPILPTPTRTLMPPSPTVVTPCKPTAVPRPTDTPLPEPTATPRPTDTPLPQPTATPRPTEPPPEPTTTPPPTERPPEPTATPPPTVPPPAPEPTATPPPTVPPPEPGPTATPTPTEGAPPTVPPPELGMPTVAPPPTLPPPEPTEPPQSQGPPETPASPPIPSPVGSTETPTGD